MSNTLATNDRIEVSIQYVLLNQVHTYSIMQLRLKEYVSQRLLTDSHS